MDTEPDTPAPTSATPFTGKANVVQIAVDLPSDDPDDPWPAPEGHAFAVIVMPLADVRRIPMFEDLVMTLGPAPVGDDPLEHFPGLFDHSPGLEVKP